MHVYSFLITLLERKGSEDSLSPPFQNLSGMKFVGSYKLSTP